MPLQRLPQKLISGAGRKRLFLRLGIVLAAVLALGLVGVFLFVRQSMRQSGPAQLSEDDIRRGVYLRLGTESEIFSDPNRADFLELAQTLEPLVGDLESEVEQAEAARLDQDPYLAETLENPVDSAIFDGDKRVDETDNRAISDLADHLIEEFESHQGPSKLSPDVRNVLLNAFGLDPSEAESNDKVMSAFESGLRDPLLYFVIRRINRPSSAEAYTIAENIQLCEQEGSDPVLDFLVYSELPTDAESFSQEECGKHYQRLIELTGDVIQKFEGSSEKVNVLLNIIWQAMPRANGNAQLALFEHLMDAKPSPPWNGLVFSWPR